MKFGGKIFFILLILLSVDSFGQEMLNSIPVSLINGNRDVFQVVCEDSKTVLFVSDKKLVRAFLLNERMQTLDTISLKRPDKTFTEIAGYVGSSSRLSLFWETDKHTSLLMQSFVFGDRSSDDDPIAMQPGNGHFLGSFSAGGKFGTLYLDGSLLRISSFDALGSRESKDIDLLTLRGSISDAATIPQIFAKTYSEEEAYTIQQISAESPTPLTDSSKKRKYYVIGKKLIMTFDNNHRLTQVLVIGLDDFSAKLSAVEKPKINFSDVDISSNSFVISDELYQIVTSSAEISISIKDLDGKLKHEYRTSADKTMEYKNSGFTRLNRFSSSERTLGSTAQFLKKISNNNLGISCYEVNGKTLATIGSVSEESAFVGGAGAAPGFGGMGFAGSGGFGFAITFVAFNQVSTNFAAYSKRKVVFTNSVFDKEGDHVGGELPKLAFDKINDFLSNYPEDSIHTIYKMGKSYYLGYYNGGSQQFVIRKFDE